MYESAENPQHPMIIPETSSPVYGEGSKEYAISSPVVPDVQAQPGAATVSDNHSDDRIAELSERILAELQTIPVMKQAIEAKKCTSSALSRHLNTVNITLDLELPPNSITRGRIMIDLRERFARDLGVTITSNFSPRGVEPLEKDVIDRCVQQAVSEILQLRKNSIRFSVITGAVRTWVNANDVPRSHKNFLAFAVQEKLEKDHGVTVADSSVARLHDRTPHIEKRVRRLSVERMAECVHGTELPEADKKYAITILTKAFETLTVTHEGAVSYAGMSATIGKALRRHSAVAGISLRGDALKQSLKHIAEYLCGQEGYEVIGADHGTPRPKVTGLHIVIPSPQVTNPVFGDDDDDLHDDGLFANESDDYSDEYEDVDFEALGIDPGEPTKANPGSEEKVLILAARYAAGMPLWHNDDSTDQTPRRGRHLDQNELLNLDEPEDKGLYTTTEEREKQTSKSIAERIAKMKKLKAKAGEAKPEEELEASVSALLQKLDVLDDDDERSDDEIIVSDNDDENSVPKPQSPAQEA